MSLLWPILLRAIKSPNRLAVIDDQRTYTYGSLAGAAFFVAEAIKNRTASRHVGVMLPTSGAFAATLLAAWLVRRVPVPFNYLLAPDELDYVIRDSDIDTIVTVGPMIEHLGGESVIPDGIQLIKLEDLDFTGFPELCWPPSYDADDLAVILYTSGTSGRPKGVMLTHGNLRSNVEGAIEHADFTAADKFLGVLPQFHSFGLTGLTLIPLRAGATVVYTARFVPRRMVQLINKHQPAIFMAVPSMYGAMLSVKNASADDFKSIRLAVSGGEPLPGATYEAFLDRFGLKILEGYGLTETSPITNWSTPQRNRQRAVGLALPMVDIMIVNENDRVVGNDTEGEIVIAGPNIMKGYYKLPDQTASVMMDLPDRSPGASPVRAFRTGDIGKLDDDGFLYITGRKKEMLIIGGENVFPREIEEVLNRVPAIKDSAVIGKTDGMRGEVPIAFVELENGQTLDEAAARNLCRQNLAQFKVPKEIRVMDELPRNPTGKVLRRKLTVD